MVDMVKRFCNTFLVEGVFVIALGIMILILPMFSSFAFSLILSVALMLAGIYKLISSVVRRDEIANSWLSSIIALLMIVSGVYLTIRPLFSMLVLTMAIGVYFVLEGINSMIIAFESKGLLKHWWVGIVSGLLQFGLAFMILFWLPSTALYAVGVLIGVNMLLSGISMISVYTGAGCRRMTEA